MTWVFKTSVGLVHVMQSSAAVRGVHQRIMRVVIARWYRYMLPRSDRYQGYDVYIFCQLVGGSLPPTVPCFPDVEMLLGPRWGGV